MVTTTFVPSTDNHLAASLKVGESAGLIYRMSKGAEAMGFPVDVIAELRDAHAALNRAAMKLVDISIARNAPACPLAHYTAMADEAMEPVDIERVSNAELQRRIEVLTARLANDNGEGRAALLISRDAIRNEVIRRSRHIA